MIIDEFMKSILINNIKIIAVILLLSYPVTKSKSFNKIIKMEHKANDVIKLSLYFGIISVVGGISDIEMFSGAVVQSKMNISLVVGMIAGPQAGLLTGVISAVSILVQDKYASIPMAISSILAGLLGGLLLIKLTKHRMSWRVAFIATILCEISTILLIVFILKPTMVAILYARTIGLSMAIVNSLGAALLVSFLKDIHYSKELTGENYALKTLETISKTLSELENGLSDGKLQSIANLILDATKFDCISIYNEKSRMAFSYKNLEMANCHKVSD